MKYLVPTTLGGHIDFDKRIVLSGLGTVVGRKPKTVYYAYLILEFAYDAYA